MEKFNPLLLSLCAAVYGYFWQYDGHPAEFTRKMAIKHYRTPKAAKADKARVSKMLKAQIETK